VRAAAQCCVAIVATLILAAVAVRAQPAVPHGAMPADVAAPDGLPAIGKWMIAGDGSIAHWLGEIYEGKRLREPINVIVVDAAATSPDHAKERLIAAAIAAGYPVRFGHSTGYRALIGSELHPQLPAGRDDAFSNGIFELSNNHGRMFGPHKAGDVYVATGAFSREEVRPFRWPEHGYASFQRARDDFAHQLDRATAFKLSGFAALDNALTSDPGVTTGDHDGRAVVLRAGR
jgi:hypothetical protein